MPWQQARPISRKLDDLGSFSGISSCKQKQLRPHGVRSRASVKAFAEEVKVLTNARLLVQCEIGEEEEVRQEERSAMHTQFAWRSCAFMKVGASTVMKVPS